MRQEVHNRAYSNVRIHRLHTIKSVGIDAMCKAYKKGRRKRRDAGDDEAETSADESRADPGAGEPERTASAAEGTLG